MKIGIDFGSTYSTFSMYDSKEKRPRALSLTEGSAVNVPTVVSLEDGELDFGKGAKERVGEEYVRIFEAFKMLLTETSCEMLRKRNYDDTYTPKSVAEYFLKSNLLQVLERSGTGDKKFEQVVICVPEIWGRDLRTLDGRSILREILQSSDMKDHVSIDQVRVVTEPEAASAFFAYNFEKETGQLFNGHLLLIDYGGGTLDITLTEVKSDGEGTMEIGYREGGGAGENHPDKMGNGNIGNAGIAYMQSVIIMAMRTAGLLGSEELPDYTESDFLKAVKRLETDLMTRSSDLKKEFGSYGDLDEIFDEEPTPFGSILRYHGKKFKVTYQQLYQAYKETIAEVLKEKLDEINKKVQEHIKEDPCSAVSGTSDRFKIALVGGFGTYYLVQRQIAEMYNFSTSDQRQKNISVDNREQAISLGAALLAEGVVVLQKTARYSIGLWASDADQKKRVHYGIKFHQRIKPGEPYYICREDGTNSMVPIVYANLKKIITQFVIEFSECPDEGGLMAISPELKTRLLALPKEGFWQIGFSMDESDIVSMHIVPMQMAGANFGTRELKIPLENLHNLFDLTEVRRVKSEE
jgi:molecular chaperone DnaK